MAKAPLTPEQFHQVLHDISTPATIISLNVNLLKEALHLSAARQNAEIQKYIDRLTTGSDQLNQLLNTLRKDL